MNQKEVRIKRIENLVAAYNGLNEKEKQLEEFFNLEEECNFFVSEKKNIFEGLVTGVPEEKHLEIIEMALKSDTKGIYKLICEEREEDNLNATEYTLQSIDDTLKRIESILINCYLPKTISITVADGSTNNLVIEDT